jgi:hypothetical protein
MKPGTIVRFQAKLTPIRVEPDAVPAAADGKFFKLYLSKKQIAELGGRAGNVPIPQFAFDRMVLVGTTEPYPDGPGKGASYLSLFDVDTLFNAPEITRMIAAEQKNRRDRDERASRRETERLFAELAKTYRRTFRDVSGSYQVDALAMKVDAKNVTLYVFETKKLTVVEREKLSEADRRWIAGNEAGIKLNGKKLTEFVGACGK